MLKTFISRLHCSAVSLVNERLDKPAHTPVSLYSQEHLCGGGSAETRPGREPASEEPGRNGLGRGTLHDCWPFIYSPMQKFASPHRF